MTKNKTVNEVKERYCIYCEEIDDFYPLPENFDVRDTFPIVPYGEWNKAQGKNKEVITVKEVNRRREENKKIKTLQEREKVIMNEFENIQVNASMPTIERLNIVQNIIKKLNSLQDEYNLISPWFPLFKEIEKAKLIESTIESLLDNKNTNKKNENQDSKEKNEEEYKELTLSGIPFSEKNSFMSIVNDLNDKNQVSVYHGKYCINAISKASAIRTVISIFYFAEEQEFIEPIFNKSRISWKYITDHFCYKISNNQPEDFESGNLSNEYAEIIGPEKDHPFECDELNKIRKL